MTVNTQELWDLLNDFGDAAQGRDWETDAQAAAQNYSNKAANLWRGIIALLAENDALRAELQARQWQPIETAPHDQEVLLGWYEWDGAWKTEVGAASWGWRTDRVSNISKHGRATHWQTLPPAPPQGETA